jgi:hypothetical protein
MKLAIPPSEDRAWIHEHLRVLIDARGSRTFLESKLFEPTADEFPGERSGSVRARRLLARLLQAATLGGHPFDLDLDGRFEAAFHYGDAAAWFAGLEDDGTLRFGITDETLGDPLGIVGVLCHEVAHAYRARHGLEFFDAREEELQTDLTTVFLGFGLLTADLAEQYRGRSVTLGGYLSAAAMSYVLAVQLAARDVRRPEVERLARLMGPRQELFVLDGFAYVEKHREDVLAQLALSSPGARSIGGHTVYRIERGWFSRPRCSGVDCKAALPRDAKICKSCGGVVIGQVRSEEEARSALENAELALGRQLLAGSAWGSGTERPSGKKRR